MAHAAPAPFRLGMLTPSSNTVVEPVLARMVADLSDLSVHFARFPVTEISLSDAALDQFDPEPMLAAARLLADARVHDICWNGTSAGWLGFERDRALVAAIEEATGTPASTAVLSLDALLRRRGLGRIAFVTPYTDDVQARIGETFDGEGYEVVAAERFGISENFAFAEIRADEITARIRRAARVGPEAIVVFCTNMAGAPLAAELEEAMGIPILDTVATSLWGAMRAAGAEPARVRGWGELFGW